jgi:hypothetical protein
MLSNSTLSISQRLVHALAFTADIWSDKWKQSFISVFVCWLTDKQAEQNLAHKPFLLSFFPIYGQQTGEKIAEAVHDCLRSVGFMPLHVHTTYWQLLCPVVHYSAAHVHFA